MKDALPLFIAGGISMALPAMVQAQTMSQALTVSSCGAASYTANQPFPLTMNTSGLLCTPTGSGGGGAVTITSGGVAAGAYSAGAFVSGMALDGWDVTQGAKADAAWTTGNGSVVAILKAVDRDILASLPAGTNLLGSVNLQPSASATYATSTSVTSAAAACQVVKASAGTLYSASGYVSAASWIMVFNATSAPANGTVTPVSLAYAPAAGAWSINYGTIPTYLSTGITVCASSTGPYTLTQFSTSNFISGQFQ